MQLKVTKRHMSSQEQTQHTAHVAHRQSCEADDGVGMLDRFDTQRYMVAGGVTGRESDDRRLIRNFVLLMLQSTCSSLSGGSTSAVQAAPSAAI